MGNDFEVRGNFPVLGCREAISEAGVMGYT